MGLKIEYIPRGELVPYEHNPRVIDKAVDKVAESIRLFGFNVPVLVDEKKTIIAGHTRLKAAELLGMEKIPCIVLSGLSEDQVRQLRIVDNKVGEASSWDYEKLILELDKISEINMDAFELGGFDEVGEDVEVTKTDEGKELDLSDFDAEQFNRTCPFCGFRWHE